MSLPRRARRNARALCAAPGNSFASYCNTQEARAQMKSARPKARKGAVKPAFGFTAPRIVYPRQTARSTGFILVKIMRPAAVCSTVVTVTCSVSPT